MDRHFLKQNPRCFESLFLFKKCTPPPTHTHFLVSFVSMLDYLLLYHRSLRLCSFFKVFFLSDSISSYSMSSNPMSSCFLIFIFFSVYSDNNFIYWNFYFKCVFLISRSYIWLLSSISLIMSPLSPWILKHTL